MSAAERCPKHGQYMPCTECIIDEGWADARAGAERARRATAGSDGPTVRDVKPLPPEESSSIPGALRHQAAQMMEGLMDPVKMHPMLLLPEPIPWVRDDLGRWHVMLDDGMELAIYGDLVILFHCTVMVCDREVKGTEVEQKAAAIALASEFGMRFLSKLPRIV